MTTVYGVTPYGAKLQILRQLECMYHPLLFFKFIALRKEMISNKFLNF